MKMFYVLAMTMGMVVGVGCDRNESTDSRPASNTRTAENAPANQAAEKAQQDRTSSGGEQRTGRGAAATDTGAIGGGTTATLSNTGAGATNNANTGASSQPGATTTPTAAPQ